jgi:hypothetical protein
MQNRREKQILNLKQLLGSVFSFASVLLGTNLLLSYTNYQTRNTARNPLTA